MEIGKIEFAKYDAFSAAVAQVREERGLPSCTSSYPMPKCKPPPKPAEEMLKKALEFANQGMDENSPEHFFNRNDYNEGKYYAYEDMAAHLEMLIKEARQ